MKKDTLIVFSEQQLDKILNSFNEPTDILTSGEIALLAAIVGALAAIVPQLIIYFLSQRTEKVNRKNDLIAEERSLSVSFVDLCYRFSTMYVRTSFYYRAYELSTTNKEGKDYYQQFLITREQSIEYLEKIRLVKADYFRIVTKFVNHHENKKIIKLLGDIKSNDLQESIVDFFEFNTIDKLDSSIDGEIDRVRSGYKKLFKTFDDIYEEMIK